MRIRCCGWCRTFSLLLGVIALFALPVRHARAQSLLQEQHGPRFLLDAGAHHAEIPVDVAHTPILRQRISLDLRNATLKEALGSISGQAGLPLFYSDDVVHGGSRVSLKAENITVAAALAAVLVDADVDVVFNTKGKAALRKRARETREVGAITGQVTDAATGQGIVGAMVSVEKTSSRTATGDGGRYRIANVPSGTYTVMARRIGYTPISRQVTVAASGEAHLDFALHVSASKLDQVVVTGTIVPTEVKALPTPVTVVSSAEIEQQRPRRIDQLIRQVVPGSIVIDAARNPEVLSTSVRGTSTLDGGAGGGSLKTYVDGVEIADILHSGFDPSSIERIEVIRGPQAAAIYGSDAIGGVLQIFTKHGDPSQQRPHVELQSALGTLEGAYPGSETTMRQEYRASLQDGGTFGSYRLSGSYIHNGNWLPEAALTTKNLDGGLRFARDPVTVDVSAGYVAFERGTLLNPDLAQTGYSDFTRLYHQDVTSPSQRIAAHVLFTPWSWWRHSISIGVDKWGYDLRGVAPRLLTPDDTLLQANVINRDKTSIGYNTSVTIPLSTVVSADVTAGIDHYTYHRYQMAGDGLVSTSGTIEVSPMGFLGYQREVIRNTGYFAQAQVNVDERLFLTGAVRAEQNTNFGEDLGVPVSPRVGIAYAQDVGPATIKLRASYGKAIRPPNPGQRSASFFPGSEILANPLLKPERQVGPDAGLDLAFGGRGSLGITYYHQIARDLIQLVDLPTRDSILLSQWQNVARVRNTGVEFQGTLHAGMLDVRAQYAIANSIAEDLGPSYYGDLQTGDRILGLPHQSGGATITLAPWLGTNVTVGLAYTGPRTNTDYLAVYRCYGGTGPCLATDRDYWIHYPAFVRTDVSATQRITRTLSGTLTVENLGNTKRNDGDNATTVFGRMTMLGLQWRY